jgi:NAD(P)-dependent dehydrogenase (short-subunit alcohol dehydrogenase family)
MPAVLITGTSSGIGHAACELFAKRGWNVLAGSRNPEKAQFAEKNIRSMRLDVNDPASVQAMFAELEHQNVRIDCVVNNAGWGFLFPFESTPREKIEEMFRTNVFGLMEMCRHACKHMRTRGASGDGPRGGAIVNISSVLGQIGTPLYSIYCATKWAVEGFSESLAHEVARFGIRVKIVEPGGTRTHFHDVAYDTKGFALDPAYEEEYRKKVTSHDQGVNGYDTPEHVADVIYQASTDTSARMRYPVGRDPHRILRLKRLLGPERLWRLLHSRM